MSASETSQAMSIAAVELLSGGGEMGALIRAKDWARTPVGPAEQWPQSLRTALGILLDSGYAMYIAWGRDFTQFYNDAYRPILGQTKHPSALGESTRVTFPEIWDSIGPMFQKVMDQGVNTTLADHMLPLNRNGFVEECYFTFSYSAIRAEAGTVGGVFVTVIETTDRVIGERRLLTLRELAAQASDARSTPAGIARAIDTLAHNRFDIPAALIYMLDETRAAAVLQGGFGFPDDRLDEWRRIEIGAAVSALPLAAVLQSGRAARVQDIEPVFGRVNGAVWPERVRSLLILPLSSSGQPAVSGFLVAAVSPRLQLDDDYESFLHLAANHISSVLTNARTYEGERQRAEALAALDLAKTTFFSNVSHELRTPLTLMIGPLEDALNGRDPLSPETRERLILAHRNSLRLLKLVNTLLDFSRIEAGRVSAHYEAVDLAEWTRDICSVFRSVIEKAGLRYVVDCEPLSQPVYLDRSMWEKIVLNLLSNAFKFTFEGEIVVRLEEDENGPLLEVRDTGTGIPAPELPHIFDRFYRVEGARGRTFEGTGIGLALVCELVRLHGGTIQVHSELTKGTAFRVRLRFGKEHLPPDRTFEAVSSSEGFPSTGVTERTSFAEEAERWLPAISDLPYSSPQPIGSVNKPRIVVADDNADMRAYAARLLSSEFDVIAVANGEEALAAAREHKPLLLLSDIMMPKLDGIGLVRRIRADAELASVPVILLSARVGEEARLDGLAAGADDYLQKPFGAKELLARVKSHVGMCRAREGVSQLERALRAQAESDRKRWRELLLSAPAMIAILRGPRHVFELANAAYLRAVGRCAADLIGKPLTEALPEMASQEYPKVLDEVYRTGKAFVANEVRAMLDLHGTGVLEPRYFNLAYVPSWDPAGEVEGILVHAIEVTSQVEARQAAQDSERQLRILAESIPQLVWSCQPDGQCDFLSAQWLAYTGLPASEQLGWKWLERVIHPDDQQRVSKAWIGAVEERAPYDLEYRMRRFDGTYRWFKTRGTPVRDPEGKILKWFGTCTDIEDQLNAAQEREALLKREQAARATAELLNRVGPALAGELDPRRLVQQVTDLATELAGAEFGALFHNLSNEQGESYLLYTLSGVSREAFASLPMPRNTQISGPTFRGEAIVLSADITNDPRYGHNNPYHGIPGGHPPVRSYLAVPVVSRSGEVLGGLFFGHSVPGQFTDQHAALVGGIAAQAAIALDNANLFAEAQRAQVELEATNYELRQANTDLEQFAYAAAHDLQEPLRMVTTYSELLARRLRPNADEKISTYVKFLTGASGRMILLLQDLLAYTETTRASDSPPKRVNLNSVLEKSLANVATAISENEAMVEADTLPVVLGREGHFVQLFQNLLANAIKYRKAEERPVIRVTAETNGDTARICVRDNGIGIAPEYHKQIFGVFRRLHGSEIPGTGIGLAICQRVVERAGGRLWVESDAGQGAAFFFELPLAPEGEKLPQ